MQICVTLCFACPIDSGISMKVHIQHNVIECCGLTRGSYCLRIRVALCCMLCSLYSDVLGMVTLSNLTSKMVRGQAKTSDPVTTVSYTQLHKVYIHMTVQKKLHPELYYAGRSRHYSGPIVSDPGE